MTRKIMSTKTVGPITSVKKDNVNHNYSQTGHLQQIIIEYFFGIGNGSTNTRAYPLFSHIISGHHYQLKLTRWLVKLEKLHCSTNAVDLLLTACRSFSS